MQSQKKSTRHIHENDDNIKKKKKREIECKDNTRNAVENSRNVIASRRQIVTTPFWNAKANISSSIHLQAIGDGSIIHHIIIVQ